MSETEDLDRVLRTLGGRDPNQEGIPTFLVMEDPTPNAAPQFAADGRLGLLAESYLGRLVSDRSRPSPKDVATVLEVLGACHFDPEEGAGSVIESAAFEGLASGPVVRAINYHNTPRALEAGFEHRLTKAAEKCRAVDEADLHDLLSGLPWPHPEPPLLPVFYEGYRNNYDVALPILERAGLCGWFFIPTAFIDAPIPEQRRFAQAHEIGLTDDEHGDGRYAMSWDELRDVVARGHVVACHTATHCAAAAIADSEDAQRELVDSRARLEDELDREVRILAWLLGAPHGENPRVDAAVRDAGYRLMFSNTKIQRIPETP